MTLNQPEHHQFTVGAQRSEIMLRDGSAVTLLPVFEHGDPCPYLRAATVAGETRVVDVRLLVRQLGDEIAAAPARDVPGLVFFSLREHYANARQLIDRIVAIGTPLRAAQGASA